MYVCIECEHRTRKWFGRCPECGTWDSLAERSEVSKARRGSTAGANATLCTYPEIEVSDQPRTSTGIGELDRVLGGGLVQGAVVLLGGEPGIGKSTLLLQVADSLSESGGLVLYVSGEESPAQVRLRAGRPCAARGSPAREMALQVVREHHSGRAPARRPRSSG